MGINSTTIAAAIGVLGASFLMAQPAAAVCGNQCEEAKKFCKNWEKANPGEECGTVRGYSCTGSSWKRIKVVNSSWSACRLVKGVDDLKTAEARCAQYEKNEGGTCQVHSPLCNAGWRSIGDYGKFRACRPLDPSGSALYDGYKSFFSQVEGVADIKIPEHLHPFIKKHYSFDPASVRFGQISKLKNASCITDCNKIYCRPNDVMDPIRSGFGWSAIHFHELQHVQQCKDVGGREAYGKMWFKQIPGAFFKALFTKDAAKFGDEVHDAMPMEKNAAAKEAITAEYVREFWHTQARCRLVRADTNEVVHTSENVHPRIHCDPEFDRHGARSLKKKAEELASNHGAGSYRLAFGRPYEKKDGADQGVWLGTIDIQNKVLAVLDFKAIPEGETCPKPVTVRASIITEYPGTVTYRIHYGSKVTGWRKVESKKAKILTGEGNLARVEEKLPDEIGPDNDGNVRLEIMNSDQSAQTKLTMTCPPVKAEKLAFSLRHSSPTACQRDVQVKLTVISNGPGLVPVTIDPAFPGMSPNLLVGVKRIGDQYLGTIETTLKIKGDFHQVYRARARTGDATAATRVEVYCLDVTSGTLSVKPVRAGLCRAEATLSMRADLNGDINYRLDCTGDRSFTRTVKSRETGPGAFLAEDKVQFNSKDGEQVSCVLKSLTTGQPKIVTMAGHKFICPKTAVAPGAGSVAPLRQPVVPSKPEPKRVKTGAGQPPERASAGPQRAKPQQPAACRGGRVVSGKCICPAGKAPKRGVCAA